jgi:hypothetical protein
MNLKDIETETGESVQDVLDRAPAPEEVQREAELLLTEVRAERRARRQRDRNLEDAQEPLGDGRW